MILAVNWFDIQLIWLSNDLGIWDSSDLVASWFGIQASRRFPFLRDFIRK